VKQSDVFPPTKQRSWSLCSLFPLLKMELCSVDKMTFRKLLAFACEMQDKRDKMESSLLHQSIWASSLS